MAPAGGPIANSPQAHAQGLVRLRFDGTCCELELANPPLNLVTQQLLKALYQALLDIEARADVRCLILHQGAARAFCAGSDMREFEQIAHTAVESKILFEEHITRRLAQLACPTIAVIDGPALGGGMELALACDLRLASPTVKLGLPEAAIGGLGGSGAVRVARLVGPARAAELLFIGRTLDADEALQWGLVNQVVDAQPVLERAREWARLIASRGPLSNRYAKQLVAASLDGPMTDALGQANQLQERIFQSRDLYQGVRAFFDKGTPVFEGR